MRKTEKVLLRTIMGHFRPIMIGPKVYRGLPSTPVAKRRISD